MGTLYIVGTPIGNLSDFSPHAIEVLKSVDFIAAKGWSRSVMTTTFPLPPCRDPLPP